MIDRSSPIRAPGSFTRVDDDAMTLTQRRSGLVAILVLALLGGWTLHAFVPALAWAVIIAISLWPWRTRALALWPGGAELAWPTLFTVMVAGLFVVPLIMVAHAVAVDGRVLLEWSAEVRSHGLPMPDFIAHLPGGESIASWWREHLSTPAAFGNLRLSGDPAVSPLNTGEHLLAFLLRRTVLALFLLVIVFFLMRDGEAIARSLRFGCRRAFGDAGVNVAMQALHAVRGTVNGLVVVGFGEGVLLGVVYALAGAPHAALLGLLTGLLSAIPFGAAVAAAGAAALLAAAGHVVAAALVAVIAAVVIFVADHFVRPVMIGDATRLPFVLVLLGILGGIEAWGLVGLVLGPALIAVLMLLWREWVGSQQGPLNPCDEAAPSPP